MFVFVVIK